ncbi:hypothetical protein EON70_00305 [bacterium]|nr:MAG: hypothetical protein EON70_00305 [bacterium]
MEKIIISCLESRVETNRSMYARFLLGPFKDDQAVTIGTALRRSLLSKVKSIAITAIHIQGVTHEYSTIIGVRESVLDLALNFQQVVLRTQANKRENAFNRKKNKSKIVETSSGLKSQLELKRKVQSLANKNSVFVTQTKFQQKQNFGQALANDSLKRIEIDSNSIKPSNDTVKIGYLQVKGPAVIYANDLKLPIGVECVDPTQYIATLSTEGLLVVKFLIGEKSVSFENNQDKLIANLSPNIQNGYQNIAPTKLLSKPSLSTTSFKAPSESLSQSASLGDLDNFKLFDSTISLRNTIFLDPLFDSVLKVNYIIEKDDLFNQPRERLILELWTNGGIHPRQALHKASLFLISTFSIFRNVFHLDSL